LDATIQTRQLEQMSQGTESSSVADRGEGESVKVLNVNYQKA